MKCTGESEFYALTNTVCEVVTIRQLVEELGYVFPSATHTFSDSGTARSLGMYGAASKLTRFIHRRYHFCRFYEEEGVIKILPVAGAKNPANALTKFTYGPLFIKERKYMLGVVAVTHG